MPTRGQDVVVLNCMLYIGVACRAVIAQILWRVACPISACSTKSPACSALLVSADCAILTETRGPIPQPPRLPQPPPRPTPTPTPVRFGGSTPLSIYC